MSDTPMGRIVGKWPGDETEEQINEALEQSGKCQKCRRLEDLLRWRDAEKEKPEKSGWYSVTFKGLPIPEYYHIEEGWCGPLRFWRPIGEMPGGKTYEPD